jgi:Long-chain acyl-CoA synthetases (AMP-forming)
MSYTPKYLIENKNKYPDEPALSVKINDEWSTLTWLEYYEFVVKIAKSLISYNLNIGDKGAIYSYNKKEWFGCYSAMQMLNCVSVAVYHTSSSSEVEWIVGNSDSKIVFVGHNPNDNGENDKMPINRLIAIIDKLPDIEKIVLLGDDVTTVNHEKIINWNEFIEEGSNISDDEVEARMKTINGDDTSSLIYTSGTTGNPKGVELTHNNFKIELDSVGDVKVSRPK